MTAKVTSSIYGDVVCGINVTGMVVVVDIKVFGLMFPIPHENLVLTGI